MTADVKAVCLEVATGEASSTDYEEKTDSNTRSRHIPKETRSTKIDAVTLRVCVTPFNESLTHFQSNQL